MADADDLPTCHSCGRPLTKGEPRYRRPDGDVHVRCFEGPRVLVVDNDAVLREVIAYQVRRERSCEVHTATDTRHSNESGPMSTI